MIAVPQTKIYTAEEYLEKEVKASARSEYRNGEIVLMAGGTPEHNAISSALNALLWLGLRGSSYQVFTADQRLFIPEHSLYTYPDVMVIPKPIERQVGRKDVVLNPIFVAEVLSNSTKNYDRGDKFLAYRTLPSFQEYLLIDQYSVRAEHYVKQNNSQWLLTEYVNDGTTLRFASVPVEIPLSDLYEDVEFEPS